jgi:hypothetical protein
MFCAQEQGTWTEDAKHTEAQSTVCKSTTNNSDQNSHRLQILVL